MARPPIERAVGGLPRASVFKPAGVPGRQLEQLTLAVDELEAIRLVDRDGLSHEQAAEAMGVSRQTVGRLLGSGRGKLADALVGGKAIIIAGGAYHLTDRPLRCSVCDARWTGASGDVAGASCPNCGSRDVAVCWGGGRRCGQGSHGRGRGCRP
jgi:uncharacterized protein